MTTKNRRELLRLLALAPVAAGAMLAVSQLPQAPTPEPITTGGRTFSKEFTVYIYPDNTFEAVRS